MKRLLLLAMAPLMMPLGAILAGCAAPKDTAEWHLYQGNKLAEEGRYDEAVEEYSKAIELDPEFAPAYNNRAYAYNSKGQYDLAIADCNKAIELDPNLASAYNNRAYAYNSKGQYDLAIADCNKAIELDPNLARAYLVRAYVYGEQEEYDLAIADANTVIQLSEDPELVDEARSLIEELGENQISDITPLANLTSLTYLRLGDNQISDIEPLVNNPGLSEGDNVFVHDNPLSPELINVYIPQLEARGVTVLW